MKLQGHTFEQPNREYCVLPRGEGKPVVFIAEAIIDYDDFETFCPEPKAPEVIKPGGVKETNFKDDGYLQAVANRATRRLAWIVITSLKATPGLEWDTVDFTDCKTWENYKKELKLAKFSHVEIQRIENAVFAANSLNEARVQEARENFLLGLAELEEQSSGHLTEPNSSQSGDPAKG